MPELFRSTPSAAPEAPREKGGVRALLERYRRRLRHFLGAAATASLVLLAGCNTPGGVAEGDDDVSATGHSDDDAAADTSTGDPSHQGEGADDDAVADDSAEGSAQGGADDDGAHGSGQADDSDDDDVTPTDDDSTPDDDTTPPDDDTVDDDVVEDDDTVDDDVSPDDDTTPPDDDVVEDDDTVPTDDDVVEDDDTIGDDDVVPPDPCEGVPCPDDGDPCNGTEKCVVDPDSGKGQCEQKYPVICPTDDDLCNGTKICKPESGACETVNEVSCTEPWQTCNKSTGECEGTPPDPCEGVECGEHGACTGGACSCKHGYTGEACEEAPVVEETPAVVINGVCGNSCETLKDYPVSITFSNAVNFSFKQIETDTPSADCPDSSISLTPPEGFLTPAGPDVPVSIGSLSLFKGTVPACRFGLQIRVCNAPSSGFPVCKTNQTFGHFK